MELLDLYDKDNKPLGLTKLRSQVHLDGDWHRVTHIYIVNDQGEYLVHLRSPLKDSSPNCWDTRFGGHVPAGYDYEETAIRELEEEIGLKVEAKDLITAAMRVYNQERDREYAQAYFCKYNGDGGDLIFSDNEVVAVKWMKPEDIIGSMKERPEQWADEPEPFEDLSRSLK